MKSNRNFFFAAVLCLPFLGWVVYLTVLGISFNRNCEGYLLRAANANTVQLAKSEMEKALAYLKKHNMTEGYTSVLYTTPDEDVGYWYQNLKASYEELSDLSSKENLSSLEQSNTLLKLRDTLCDHQDGRESLTKPSGISRFPNNTAYMFFTLMTIVLLVVAGFIVGEELDWRTT